MTLDEAIKIIELSVTTGYYGDNNDFRDAKKLLIEAGKRLQQLRGYSMTQVDTRLPGETE